MLRSYKHIQQKWVPVLRPDMRKIIDFRGRPSFKKRSTLKYDVLALLALAAVPAVAADFNDPYAPNASYAYAPGAQGAMPWQGFYLGAMGGYGWGRAAGSSIDGGLFGLTAGYNWQTNNNVVFGLEGDLAYTGINSSGAGGKFDINWLGTARARLGYGFDRFLVFGTGGVAWTTTDFAINAVGSDSGAHLGWTVGAGMEAAITQHISAKVDYLYGSFERDSYSIGAGVSAKPTVNTLRAGVNYRF